MKDRFIRVLFTICSLCSSLTVVSQVTTGEAATRTALLDSLKKEGIIFTGDGKVPEIQLSVNQSLKFLQQKYQQHNWQNPSDPLRSALGQLIFSAANPPLDSAEYLLKRFPYDSLLIPWDKFFIWEPMRLKVPVPVTGITDTTTNVTANDSVNLRADNPGKEISSTFGKPERKDTTIMVIIDTLKEVSSSYPGFPFRYFNYPYQSDSIKAAVNTLLKYLDDRDSSIVYFTGVDRRVTPVWLNSRSGAAVRFWLKNDLADSVTVWIGNPSRDTFGLYLEQGVTFRRPPKQANYSGARVDVKEVDKSTLLEVQKVYIKPKYWKTRMEANLILNQSALSNWVKGGENSLSTSLDVTEFANYENKAMNVSSSNFARIKLGFLTSGGSPIRKNLDLIETNSKLNHKAFGKFDFSAFLLFKTQLLKGYNYPNDSVPVSKLFNPAIVTLGIGLDYKPNKTTSINFSPFSYKGTYMTDTAHIDQTLYGIPHDRKALHEPGVSLLVTNEFKPVKSLSITNRVQFFTNYVNNPMNIDVDWEMIATASLNWFTDVRFNTHLIYDDDTKTPVIEDGKPVLNPDGSQKKTSRIQFKEMLGFSLVFRF